MDRKIWQLGELLKSSKKKGKTGLPLLSVTLHNGLVVRDSLERKMETNLDPTEHLLIEQGCIAYNMMRVWQGALGRADIDGLVSPAYVVLEPTGEIDSLYAEYLFKSPRLIYLFWAYSYGLTQDRLRLYYKDFARISFEFPVLEQQKKISQILSIWDKSIETAEKLLIKSKAQKKSLLQKLLTGKKRLPGYKGKWEVQSLGNLFKERVETNRSDLPLLSITSDRGVIFQGESGRKNNSNDNKSKYRRICVDDIGYNTMRMWQGRSCISDKEGIVSPAYTILEATKEACPLYASYLFKLPELVYVFYRHSQGLVSDTWNLKYNHFKKITWTFPPLEEQQAIARVLKIADEEIELLASKIEYLKQEKKALMQQLLTGKVRVKVDKSKAA